MIQTNLTGQHRTQCVDENDINTSFNLMHFVIHIWTANISNRTNVLFNLVWKMKLFALKMLKKYWLRFSSYLYACGRPNRVYLKHKSMLHFSFNRITVYASNVCLGVHFIGCVLHSYIMNSYESSKSNPKFYLRSTFSQEFETDCLN